MTQNSWDISQSKESLGSWKRKSLTMFKRRIGSKAVQLSWQTRRSLEFRMRDTTETGAWANLADIKLLRRQIFMRKSGTGSDDSNILLWKLLKLKVPPHSWCGTGCILIHMSRRVMFLYHMLKWISMSTNHHWCRRGAISHLTCFDIDIIHQFWFHSPILKSPWKHDSMIANWLFVSLFVELNLYVFQFNPKSWVFYSTCQLYSFFTSCCKTWKNSKWKKLEFCFFLVIFASFFLLQFFSFALFQKSRGMKQKQRRENIMKNKNKEA